MSEAMDISDDCGVTVSVTPAKAPSKRRGSGAAKKSTTTGTKRKTRKRIGPTPEQLAQYTVTDQLDGMHLRDNYEIYFKLYQVADLRNALMFCQQYSEYVALDFTVEGGLSFMLSDSNNVILARVAFPIAVMHNYKCKYNTTFTVSTKKFCNFLRNIEDNWPVHFAYSPHDPDDSVNDESGKEIGRKTKEENIVVMVTNMKTGFTREFKCCDEITEGLVLSEMPINDSHIGCRVKMNVAMVREDMKGFLHADDVDISFRRRAEGERLIYANRSGEDPVLQFERRSACELIFSYRGGRYISNANIRYGVDDHEAQNTHSGNRFFDSKSDDSHNIVTNMFRCGRIEGDIKPEFDLMKGEVYHASLSQRYLTEILNCKLAYDCTILMDLKGTWLHGSTSDGVPHQEPIMIHRVVGFRFDFGENNLASMVCFVATKVPDSEDDV